MRSKRTVVTAVMLTIAALALCAWFGRGIVLGEWAFVDACDPDPIELRRLGDEEVFQSLPLTATPIAPPQQWEPCQAGRDDHGSGRKVEYSSVLSDDAIARHYQAVAWDAGWDRQSEPVRLLSATKWIRQRCFELGVARAAQPGSYTVEVSFGLRYDRSLCDRKSS